MLLYREWCLHGSQRLTLRLSFVRSSLSQIFFKKGVIKNFVQFTGKHLSWSLFLTKFKTGSNTDVFPWNFVNFLEYLFYRTHPVADSRGVLRGNYLSKNIAVLFILTLIWVIWVGFLGVRFKVRGEGGNYPLSKTC